MRLAQAKVGFRFGFGVEGCASKICSCPQRQDSAVPVRKQSRCRRDPRIWISKHQEQRNKMTMDVVLSSKEKLFIPELETQTLIAYARLQPNTCSQTHVPLPSTLHVEHPYLHTFHLLDGSRSRGL